MLKGMRIGIGINPNAEPPKVVAAVTGFTLLAVYWLAMGLTNQYESYATILVEPQSVSPDRNHDDRPDDDLLPVVLHFE